jgi:hypothetical protein
MTSEHKCSHCQEVKSAEKFYISKDKVGRKRIRMCLDCRKNYRKKSDDYYQRVIAEQNGLCAICGVAEVEHGRRFNIDHDHSTGKYRGLLCIRCNIGIGYFKDNRNHLSKAIEYLDTHNNNQ